MHCGRRVEGVYLNSATGSQRRLASHISGRCRRCCVHEEETNSEEDGEEEAAVAATKEVVVAFV